MNEKGTNEIRLKTSDKETRKIDNPSVTEIRKTNRKQA